MDGAPQQHTHIPPIVQNCKLSTKKKRKQFAFNELVGYISDGCNCLSKSNCRLFVCCFHLVSKPYFLITEVSTRHEI